MQNVYREVFFLMFKHSQILEYTRSQTQSKYPHRVLTGATLDVWYLYSGWKKSSAALFYHSFHQALSSKAILSFSESPIYSLCNLVAELAATGTGTKQLTVRKSNEFVQLVRDQMLDDSDVMAPFDVVSLSTNVQTNASRTVAEARFRSENTLSTLAFLTVQYVRVLLRFCLNQTHFAFRCEIYHQTAGCPDGSTVSLNVANIVMEHLEDTALQRTRRAPTYSRYIIVLLRRDDLTGFESTLNDLEPTMQFTHEAEQHGMACFRSWTSANAGTKTARWKPPFTVSHVTL